MDGNRREDGDRTSAWTRALGWDSWFSAVSVVLAVGSVCGVVVALVETVASALEPRRVDDIPFCPVFARGRVGADWASRLEIAGESTPGEIDEFATYDRADFDSSAIHPEIRRFYERTADYDLAYETSWHRGFRVGAWLASFGTSRLEQLNLPGRSGGVRWLESEIAAVSLAVDPRGSRVWTRTDPETNEAVFVALYATHERDGATYANVAVPLPWANLSTVLRPEGVDSIESAAEFDSSNHDSRDSDSSNESSSAGDSSDETSNCDDGTSSDEAFGAQANGYAGVEFTTRGPGDGGLYLVTPLGAFEVPMDQTFRVLPAARPSTPSAGDPPLVATHEMWIFGKQFLTIRYAIERSSRRD